MKITFLGTGSTAGVPVMGCQCPACQQAMFISNLQRKNATALLEVEGETLVLDAGISSLADRLNGKLCENVFISRFSADHVGGLFRMRWAEGVNEIKVFCPTDSKGCADLSQNPGVLAFEPLCSSQTVGSKHWQVRALAIRHGKPLLGYAIESQGQRLAYLSDCRDMPEASWQWLEAWGAHVVAVGVSTETAQQTDNADWQHVMALVDRLQPNLAVLTRVDHAFDNWLHQYEDQLPLGVMVARDGVSIDIGEHLQFARSLSHVESKTDGQWMLSKS